MRDPSRIEPGSLASQPVSRMRPYTASFMMSFAFEVWNEWDQVQITRPSKKGLAGLDRCSGQRIERRSSIHYSADRGDFDRCRTPSGTSALGCARRSLDPGNRPYIQGAS